MTTAERIKWFETTEPQLKAALDQFIKDAQFLEAIRPELQQKYKNHWIAVYKGGVVTAGKDLKEVIRQLIEKKIPSGHAVVQFLSTEQVALVL